MTTFRGLEKLGIREEQELPADLIPRHAFLAILIVDIVLIAR